MIGACCRTIVSQGRHLHLPSLRIVANDQHVIRLFKGIGITMFSAKVSPLLISLTLIGFSSALAQVRKPADVSSGVQQIVYYSAQARKTFLVTVPGFKAGTSATEKVLMVKSFDRQNGRFKEVACVSDGSQPAYISPVYMKVEGNRISAISDTPDFGKPNKLTGTGSPIGKRLGLELPLIFAELPDMSVTAM